MYAQAGKDKVVALLVESKANVRAEDANKDTPLHYAARAGFDVIADTLCSKLTPADINAVNNDKQTAFHLAAVHKNFDVAESLIRHGTDSDLMDSQGKTPFELIDNNDIKERLVKRLKARELKDKEENSKLFDGAAQGDMVKVFQCLAIMTATAAMTAAIPGSATTATTLKTNESTNIIDGNAGKLVIRPELINAKNEEDQTALLLAVNGQQPQVRSKRWCAHSFIRSLNPDRPHRRWLACCLTEALTSMLPIDTTARHCIWRVPRVTKRWSSSC